MLDFAAVHGNKATLPLSIFTKVHKVRQPAFNATAIIIVGAATFIIKVSLAFKAINIKIPHHHSDIVKIFYKLAIGHNTHILRQSYTYKLNAYPCKSKRNLKNCENSAVLPLQNIIVFIFYHNKWTKSVFLFKKQSDF